MIDTVYCLPNMGQQRRRYTPFHRTLEDLKAEHGISYRRLQELTAPFDRRPGKEHQGYSPTYLNQLSKRPSEKTSAEPTMENIEVIAKAFGIGLDDPTEIGEVFVEYRPYLLRKRVEELMQQVGPDDIKDAIDHLYPPDRFPPSEGGAVDGLEPPGDQ